MIQRSLVVVILGLAAVAAAGGTPSQHHDGTISSAPTERGRHDLDTLTEWMTGSFSSAEQARSDTNFFDIRLQMVRIWRERTDGVWLYVEQASAEKLDRPYRQRVYRLTQPTDSTFESAVFSLGAPMRFAGDWRKARPLEGLTPDSLAAKEGCEIVLVRSGSAFVGGTAGKRCPSELRGASYATSEVRVTASGMTTWDRGYDAEGKQVWGAKTGGYVFRKSK